MSCSHGSVSRPRRAASNNSNAPQGRGYNVCASFRVVTTVSAAKKLQPALGSRCSHGAMRRSRREASNNSNTPQGRGYNVCASRS